MGRKNFKPIYLDYGIWSSVNDTTKRCYQLTDRQVMALQAFTDYLEWVTRWQNADGIDMQAIREWRAELENDLQLDEACGGSMDCNDVLACLDDSIEIISIKQAIYNSQQIQQSGAVNLAIAAWDASGDDMSIYNPLVPTNWNGTGSADDTKLLCIAVTAWVSELARQFYNAAIALGVAGGIAVMFGGLIAALTALIPVWLALVANVPALQLIGYTLSAANDLAEACIDDFVITTVACRLRLLLGSTTTSYANYLAKLALLPSDNPLSIAIKALCANEVSYLYLCDLIGKVHERDTEALEYDCNCPAGLYYDFTGGPQGWVGLANTMWSSTLSRIQKSIGVSSSYGGVYRDFGVPIDVFSMEIFVSHQYECDYKVALLDASLAVLSEFTHDTTGSAYDYTVSIHVAAANVSRIRIEAIRPFSTTGNWVLDNIKINGGA
jgi:hypothetical protein